MAVSNLDKLDGVIATLLQAARIPGAAIAVVHNHELVFAKGFGCRTITGEATTADTLYPIASTTKAMAATLLGMLVDENLVDWDAPVQRYLPKFRLADPVRSPLVTVRDLMTMRSGLPRHDWIWQGNPLSRAVLVEGLAHLELTAGFRQRFQYNNLTVALVGHIAEVVTTRSWEELTREKLLEPLGMTRTCFSKPTEGDFTQSWTVNKAGELVPFEQIPAYGIEPAGGAIYSSVRDMARWVMFNLSGGRTVRGQPLIAADRLAEIHGAQMAMDQCFDLSRWATYGLGWMAESYHGCTRLFHGGDLHEINSEVALFPEDNLGLVCFTNSGGSSLSTLINEHIFDTIKGLQPVTTVDAKLAAYGKLVADRVKANNNVKRVFGTSPSHPLADYAGRYHHPAYGEIVVETQAATLVVRRGVLELSMEHWHFDSWIIADPGRFWAHAQHPFERSSRWRFETDADGNVSALHVPFEPSTSPIAFARTAQPTVEATSGRSEKCLPEPMDVRS
jgi:CubicO group peptidase (beta-lactamase class C family)